MSHTSEISKHPPSPPPGVDTIPNSLYGTPEEPDHFEVGVSHNVLSQFPDYVNLGRRYFSHISSSETHLIPSSNGPFRFIILNLPETEPSSNVEYGVDLGATPRGNAIPFQEDRFGSIHIAPSTPVVGGSSHMQPTPSTSIPIRGSDPRHVNIGNTSYIPSHAPSSLAPVPLNVFLTTHPPHNSHGPSGQSTTASHVVPASAHTVVSQGYVPPYVSAGYVPPYTPPYGSRTQISYQSYNYGFVAP